ncbi:MULTISPECIES: hypothetical protein [unclassified Pseudomonas]|uniref:hypothetical protein n=1 Tax=unclassified Pseudomonas TaxID=196821 RepID=UPI0025DE065E|nr:MULTISPECIES: hypothetical protein [unclassified Pseudomonas]
MSDVPEDQQHSLLTQLQRSRAWADYQDDLRKGFIGGRAISQGFERPSDWRVGLGILPSGNTEQGSTDD